MLKRLLFIFMMSYPYCLLAHLIVPSLSEGEPSAGKKVRVYLAESLYYTVYLPYEYDSYKKWPVIFELPGAKYSAKGYELSGYPDEITMGYGLSKGKDYILVCAPILYDKNKINFWDACKRNPEWLKNTTDCWLTILNDLNHRFSIDNDNIILCGFSRGAIATIYIGNSTDEISKKWKAYYAHDWFDGGEGIDIRLDRTNNKRVLITCREGWCAPWQLSMNAYKYLLKKKWPVTFFDIPNISHTTNWLLEDSDYANRARIWLMEVSFL